MFAFVANCEARRSFQNNHPKSLSFPSIGWRNVASLQADHDKRSELKFEELKGGDRQPEEWSATLSDEDLTKLYNAFVESRFDTVRNDKATLAATDAISETISMTVGRSAAFQVTYGKNSPLSGRNLERYQAVSRAIDGLVSVYKDHVRRSILTSK